ncbi:hypothetical protein BJ138DRAFT_1144217 [Hygrophoropsis aurantiaca]|uniref:Uncharacterized protein n=1 Tax=Hygrophoropsis aurantiaca TaxID=72124 RepID=A0ACB8AMX8_9AGAM|nr:hypothetical protein BJ138DRAFT_1144217 [Hygrophoropsis aurantiaca]
MDKSDLQESTTITFEWVLRGLKNLFDSSKGESKSKVTKSVRFGGGRWQILFYANSGTDGGAFVSLYLSCEPTPEEKDGALDGKWVRDGVYKFSFELRTLGKTVLFNIKEAHNHSFSSKTANWGWAQFARRDHVYYLPNAVKEQDAFLIICTITSSPQPPIQPSTVPAQLVPKDFLERVGALLDDPLYSDVEFVLPRRGRTKGHRRIWANRKILQRADYFQSMFGSGFAEASSDQLSSHTHSDTDDGASDSTYLMRHFNDSDDEDEEDEPLSETTDEPSLDGTLEIAAPEDASASTVNQTESTPLAAEASQPAEDNDEQRNVRAKLSHPSTPRSRELALERSEVDWSILSSKPQTIPGPKKLRVVIRDVAYTTYKAVLYYIYTDVIVFAPLSSSFSPAARPAKAVETSLPAPSSESQSNLLDGQKNATQADNQTNPPTTRKDWIKRWQQSHLERPAPCSAKAVYRLADKLDLVALKERASQHIQRSLTVGNIPYEVFSPFSATFADIRKVQVNFFLEHWGEIRASDAMRNVWQQIRIGRHPGFEEVWPYIAQHLEFNPRAGGVGEGDPAAEI